ncbi:hypothetical protein NQ314_011858 [Rhamnusium bicolor]|uniref:HTH OST-type domain-containing protein n=1 Tax=Rhamnusium bicolor TaxID=1586634 RepID=A0AAV8XG77_9CUCU|nr:hypothetical protein NQ314_011858 [Rhamnusium bicolor]
MENIEKNTKKYITSLLIATPLVVTLQQLGKDYRNTIGEVIPYQKLGYNSLEHFLRSIPDTVTLRGSGPTAEVIPVVKRKMYYAPPRKHVTTFYTNPTQAPTTKKIFYPTPNGGSSVSSSSNQTSNSFDYVTYNNKISTKESNAIKTDVSAYPSQMPIVSNNAKIESVAEVSKVEESKRENRPKLENEHNLMDKTTSPDDVSKKCTNVRNLLKKLTPGKNNFSSNQLENDVPYYVRNNLRILISQCPNGIWCADVPEKYRQELNYQELGFRSLIDLCVCLSSVFHYVRPSTEDFKLYDRSRPLPDCVETKYTVASYNVNIYKNSDIDFGALPNIDPGKEIARNFIQREMADYDIDIDIVVGEIYDLSKFWIYLQDSLLDNLMDNIQALIVDVMPEVEDTIRVIFIDYGTMTKVPTKGLCFLHMDFARLPAQAIRCRLANIFPLEEGIPWSREAAKAFRRMVANRDMSIKISHINWEDQFLEVYLADVTDENNIFYINDRLVEEGFAQDPNKERKLPFVDPIYTPIVKFIHLFPTFLELEHGLAPSTAEMEIFNDCNVPINFCYPQYFYVDYTFEEKIIKAAEDFHEKNCMKGKQRSPSRYYDLDQFKSQKPDLSIFGELESEIAAFLNKPVEPGVVPSSEEHFVDAEEDFHNKLDLMTENLKYLNTKEEETVNVLKKDLLMTEDIMKDINNICKLEDQSIAESKYYEHDKYLYGDVESECMENYLARDYARELWTISETRESIESVNSMTAYKEPTGKTDEDLDFNQMLLLNHPLCKMSFDKDCSTEGENSSSCSPNSEYSPVTKNTTHLELEEPDVWLRPINFSFLSASATNLQNILPNKETESSDEVFNLNMSNNRKRRSTQRSNENMDSGFDPATGFLNSSSGSSEDLDSLKSISKLNDSSISTNPFLKDLTDSNAKSDLPADFTLNPNNPFLTFLSNKSDKEASEGSQESSTSTSYGSPIVQVKMTHSWSNFDDMSPETISELGRALSIHSNSSDSARMLDDRNNCSIATQTAEQQVKVPVLAQNKPHPYYYPQPYTYGYPNWSPGCSNPYYNVRFPNYPSYQYEPHYGPMQPCKPPPSSWVWSSTRIWMQQGPPYYPPALPIRPDASRLLPSYMPNTQPPQGAPLQFSGLSRTTSMSSVSVSVVSENKDFYDVYNEQLKIKVEDDGH